MDMIELPAEPPLSWPQRVVYFCAGVVIAVAIIAAGFVLGVYLLECL